MSNGKVVILMGTKRAGKTTTAVKLNKEYGYNYLEFDHLLDALDEVIEDNETKREKEFEFFESVLNFSLEDAKNYGINTVIVVWDFKPEQLSKLKNIEKIKIYCLMPCNIDRENLENTIIKYSSDFDWPKNCTQDDIERNINLILKTRDFYLEECEKYNIEIYDTSFEEERNNRIDNLVNIIVNGG